ncbi:MAG: L-rhamnose mutarotase, partial [Candidatus Hydrogenedentes bacterium]|nr:L-rhamnose mutarotase [Candidatus Hydrogenedentota bacterium]
MQRYGAIIQVRDDKIAEYKALHQRVWPGVLEQIKRSNIQNYS